LLPEEYLPSLFPRFLLLEQRQGTDEEYARYIQGENVDLPERFSNSKLKNLTPKNAALSPKRGPFFAHFPG